jgi:putative endonuclease
MFKVYIIKSESTSRYYTGQTQDLDKRLSRHQSNEVKSTANKGAWKLVYTLDFKTRQEAVEIERKIKKRGAARFLASADS